MTVETLNKLCLALGVTPNDLVEHDATPVPHKRKYQEVSDKIEVENTQGDVNVYSNEEEEEEEDKFGF